MVTGGYAFLGSSGFGDHRGGVRVVDVMDPAKPGIVAEWITERFNFGPTGMGLWRDRLYVADAYRTLYALRIDGLPEEVRLTARLAGDDALYLAWPSTATDFTLESSADPTATIWQSVPGTPLLNGDKFEVTIPMDSPARFFRLRKP